MSAIVKEDLLFDGNEKRIYSADREDEVIIRFNDVATAFNNVKKAIFPQKGVVNNAISSLIFEYLNSKGIYTHFISKIGERDQLCRKGEVIPLEIIVRNYIAGSLADRLDIEEGTKPKNVIIDLTYNNDELGDPLINDTQALALGIVTKDELDYIYKTAYKVNDLLIEICTKAGLKLVDFKLEFTRDSQSRLMLSDEISPDTSRFWDAASDERLDKDRYRHDLGYIVASYEKVLHRLENVLTPVSDN